MAVFGVFGARAYTIGMANLGLPDVIMTGGVTRELCEIIINNLVRQWKRDGVKYGDNLTLMQGKDGKPLKAHIRAVVVDETFCSDYVQQAVNFYSQYPGYRKTGEFMFAQLMWPDAEGKLPTEDGYLHAKFNQPIFKAVN